MPKSIHEYRHTSHYSQTALKRTLTSTLFMMNENFSVKNRCTYNYCFSLKQRKTIIHMRKQGRKSAVKAQVLLAHLLALNCRILTHYYLNISCLF